MAANTNALLTTGGSAVVGMREDLSDVVAMIGREEVPFTNFCGTGEATNTTDHKWETVTLRAPAANAKAEGDIYASTASRRGATLVNACQIVDDVAEVSDSTEAVDVAGQLNKLDKQVLIKGIELKRDLEYALLGNAVIAKTDPRAMAGIQTWAGSNDVGTGGTAPTADGTTAYAAGTLRDMSITLLNSLLNSAWSVGCKTDTMFGSSNQKLNFDAIIPDQQQLSTSMAQTQNDGAMLVSTVSIWRSAFGDIRFVMDHVLNTTTALKQVLIGFDSRPAYKPKVCPLPGRSWHAVPLAKTNRSTMKAVGWEGTLEVPNPKAVWLLGALNP